MGSTVNQTWDAAAYRENGSFVPALGADVLALLNAQPGENILDLGCGDGQLTARIVAAGASVTAIDASPQMVEAARLRGLNAHLVDAQALDLNPAFDRAFDAVFSNAVLHWISDQHSLLSGIHKTLVPGGRLVAEMGGHGNIAAIQVALLAVLRRHGYEDSFDACERNFFPTAEAYRALLIDHGFAVESIQLIPRPTPLPASGMHGWLSTFRKGVFDAIPASSRPGVLDETVSLLKPFLCDDQGLWTADYVRLRFAARA